MGNNKLIIKQENIISNNNLDIKTMIYTIRGKQVMLDRDLANLFGVETRRLNEAVKRNFKRFPIYYCFKLTEDEYNSLMSQIATSKILESKKGGYRKLPFVFTQNGVSMLSAVLNSETAIVMSIKIIDAFIEMREVIIKNANLLNKINNLEDKLIKYQYSTLTLAFL